MKGKNKIVVNPPVNEQQATMSKPNSGPSPEEKKQLEAKKRMLQKKMMLQKQAMQMQKQGRLPLNYNEENEGNSACLKCGEIHEGSCDPKSKESKETPDSRGNYAMMNLIKNKLRARGIKMSYEPQGNMVEELSVDDQMRISREANAKRKPYKDGDHQRSVPLCLRGLLRMQKRIPELMPKKWQMHMPLHVRVRQVEQEQTNACCIQSATKVFLE